MLHLESLASGLTPHRRSSTITTMSLTTKSGQAVGPLFYGTAWKKAATTSLVSLALKHGFRAIDTACQPKHYSENLVGEGIASVPSVSREDLFLQTKFTLPSGQDPNNIPYEVTAPLEDQVRQSFAKSLKNLQTHYLDAVLLHSPARTIEHTMTILNVLDEFKRKGQVRYLGISNIYSLAMLKDLCTRMPSTVRIVQNRFYPATGYDTGIRGYCKENGIVYQSFWTLSGNPHILRSKVLMNVAKRIGATVEGTFYRFCVQEGIKVLDGTTSEEHMKEDLDVVRDDKYALNGEEMEVIRGLLQ
jgi:diketogulonate reductase-like aldo/keto reductase